LHVIPITIRHRYSFREDRAIAGADLNCAAAWDKLRVGSSGSFKLSATRAALEKEADIRPEIGERMRVLAEGLRGTGSVSIASYGVGTAMAEVWLRRWLPKARLILTEYAPTTRARLQQLFPNDDVVPHDLRRDAPLDADVHIFHRIDSEFTNCEWRTIFERFATQRIVLLATELLSARSALRETSYLLTPHTTRAGWIRNRRAFELLWRSSHRSNPRRFNDLDGWVLEPLP
jgi:hypothetical protein